MHPIGHALLAGAAGALTLTALHEGGRQLVPRAPRMDVVAIRGIERLARQAGWRPPARSVLHPIALAGDLIVNSVFYAAVGLGEPRRAPLRGAILGAAAGVCSLMLPPRLGLGTPPHAHERGNQLMTVAWYLAGGLVAGLVARRLAGRSAQRREGRGERRDAGRSAHVPWYRSRGGTKVHGDDLGDVVPSAPLAPSGTP
jgi:hypothetical protein